MKVTIALSVSLVLLASGCSDLYEADPLHAAQADSSAAGYEVGTGAPVATLAASRDGSRARTPVVGTAPARDATNGSPRGAASPGSADDPRPTVASPDTVKPRTTGRDVVAARTPGQGDTTIADSATRTGPDVVTLPAELSAPADDSVIVNTFLSYNPSARTVWVDLIAGFDGANGALNFNGGFEGAHTLVIPVGWRVEARFLNRDRELSHSAIVIEAVDPIPMLAPPAAFPNAFTIALEEGIIEGRSDVVRFSADTEGRYAILCAVPGHGQSGMWVRLDVSRTATVPEYRRR